MILRPVVQPLLAPVVRGLNRAGLGFSPRLLFANNEQGFFFVNDISTMYQDSAGTTPAALEQPVGLWLDSRLGAVRGAELVTNGTFDSGTAGWTAFGGSTIAAVGGELLVTNTAGGGAEQAEQDIFAALGGAASIGKWVEISGTARLGTATSYQLLLETNAVSLAAMAGTATSTTPYRAIAYIPAGTTAIVFRCRALGVGTAFFDNISVKPLLGNHATQPTSANRPTATTDGGYQVESLDGLDDYITTSDGGQGTTGFFLCMALKVGKVGSVQTLVSDVGTNTGYRVRLNASNQLEIAAGNGTAFTTAATSDTVALNGSYVLTAWHDGAALNAQINSGGIGSASFAAASAGTAAVTIGRDNGAASNYTQGKIAQAVYVKNSIVTATVREQVKRYMASRLGVAL